MLSVREYEQIRRAYYVTGRSMREIGREYGYSYWTVRKALERAEPAGYQLSKAKVAPVLGPYKAQIEELLTANLQLPPKQRLSSKKIYQAVRQAGYQGAESTVRYYVGQQRKEQKAPTIYLPLVFDPGVDAQADWGEASVRVGGEVVVVQLFVMRLCYSRKLFVMAFPTQQQTAFLLGHVQAFAHFGGVPQRISYDNLKAAVRLILAGRNRQEQDSFIRFRSHYLFESRFCTPGQGHEKGGVESDVGYSRRNFLTPMPDVADFAELNALLLTACQEADQRVVERAGQGNGQSIGVRWRAEQPYLRPLPAHAFACCTSREVTLNGYGLVSFETNRYSAPADKARKQLTLRAYPFFIEILADNQVIAVHERCYGRHRDILQPLHYLSLLVQRPGAFEHAQPLREWREQWPPAYEKLLAVLRQQQPGENQAVRSFLQVLQLHQHYAPEHIHAAVEQALAEGLASPNGVRFCLHRLLDPTPAAAALDLSSQPDLASIGRQPVPILQYNHFLAAVVK